ncbi:transglycosylase domain-containing protein [Pediococcus claussenii]|uniref:transglycosylase domain-containing protein n=1 Tax=Pediococcus claussenii TaxID=187452 RepID=UPI00081A41B8|nr:transglycosylase domain-containing protein [Pediococcus claussenii]ANZ68820.1 carboxypeptidase [Pediococcus claussenii]ANZ70636.1 carboxypeptidase [Pediococcus claussenii]
MDNQNPNQGGRVMRRTQHTQLKNNKKHFSWWKKALLGIIGFFVLIFVLGAGLFMYYAKDSPKITRTQLASDNATVVYDANGKELTRLGAQNRDYVNRKDIPRTLKRAIVSIEDRRFYKNDGVDPIRIAGAAVANVTGSSLGLQGASTLTQQLVKLSVFSTDASDRTIRVKAQEAWLALKVDKEYSKDQILEFYINKVYMGNGVYGMQTAAEYYFGKKLDKLNLSELALLAGMPQSPTVYDPTRNPQYATARRNTVLQAMVENKEISSTDAAKAKKVSVKSGLSSTHGTLDTSKTKDKIIDPYLKQVLAELQKKGFDPNKGGLKVYTNMDYGAQKEMYNLANDGTTIQFPDDKFQVGATMVNNDNGKIVAMLGGRKTGDVTFGLNRAVQTDRSSGSTAKPLMDYGPAFQYLNWPTYRKVKDIPFTYPGTESPTKPNGIKLYDFDKKYEGTMTVRNALIQSRNIPAIRTLQDVGMSRATEFLKNLGISQKKEYDLVNGIGLYISTLQEAAAYAAFANGGSYHSPYYISKIETQSGKTYKFGTTTDKAMSAGTAFMMTSILKGVTTDPMGSGTAADIPGLNVASKTGTVSYPDSIANQYPSDAASDSWMTGYTKNYSLSVWTGYDHANTPTGFLTQQQTTIAQLVWKYMISYMAQSSPNTDWTQPSSVVSKGNNEYAFAGKSYSNTGASDLDSKNNSGSASSSASSNNGTNSTGTTTGNTTTNGNNSVATSPFTTR